MFLSVVVVAGVLAAVVAVICTKQTRSAYLPAAVDVLGIQDESFFHDLSYNICTKYKYIFVILLVFFFSTRWWCSCCVSQRLSRWGR